MFYYSANEKAYRVFEPEKNTWMTQAEKPTEEQIEEIKTKISGAGKPELAADTTEKQKAVEEAGAGEQPLTEEEIKKKEQKKQKRKRA